MRAVAAPHASTPSAAPSRDISIGYRSAIESERKDDQMRPPRSLSYPIPARMELDPRSFVRITSAERGAGSAVPIPRLSLTVAESTREATAVLEGMSSIEGHTA